MEMNQAIAATYNAITGSSIQVQTTQNVTKATPVFKSNLAQVSANHIYGQLDTGSLSHQITCTFPGDTDFSFNEWGLVNIAECYFRGTCVICAVTASHRVTSINEVSVDYTTDTNPVAIFVIYDDEKLKWVTARCKVSGKYTYLYDIESIAGKTVVFLSSSSTSNMSDIITIRQVRAVGKAHSNNRAINIQFFSDTTSESITATAVTSFACNAGDNYNVIIPDGNFEYLTSSGNILRITTTASTPLMVGGMISYGSEI